MNTMQQECAAAIERQRKKLKNLVELHNGNVNHPNLDIDNHCLDEMVLEYMFFFNHGMRHALLKQPVSDSSKKEQPPCYASMGSCGESCPLAKECLYNFFIELERCRKEFFQTK